MSEAEEQEVEEVEEEAPKKPSVMKTLLFSGVGAIALGGVAAGVAFLAPSGEATCVAIADSDSHGKKKTKSYEDIAFVNLEPLVITLGPNATSQYLKISLSLETSHQDTKTIEHLSPKFRDVLNTYLRAIDENDLADPAAMMRLRAQMLRRLQIVAPDDAISNVLITDFVLN